MKDIVNVLIVTIQNRSVPQLGGFIDEKTSTSFCHIDFNIIRM